ncbi:MAG: hypothetical protein KDJ14_05820 [Xanthomonadales bacterium]|nr:hypothetical protein [Xanthomonadales bacterium]
MLKVQLEGQSLRLRIDEAHLSRLLAGDRLSLRTCLAPAADFCFAVERIEAAAPGWRALGDGALLQLPSPALAEYVARLPCRESLDLDLALASGDRLRIEFSVDVRNSLASRGPRRRESGR